MSSWARLNGHFKFGLDIEVSPFTGHGLRLQPDLVAATITAYRRQMVKASRGKADEKEGGEKGGGGWKNRGIDCGGITCGAGYAIMIVGDGCGASA
eukprot:COSAG06_NODE_1293_length_9978_cov_25.200121_2_plen_96_part_00